MQDRGPTKWLKAAAAVVVGFGILTAAATVPGTSGPVEFIVDLIFWPLDGAQSVAAAETRLVCAIGGGVMVGWGVMLWLVAAHLGPRDLVLARTLILSSVGAWFVIDSIGSILSGAPLNAVFSIGLLLMFVVPLAHSMRRTKA